ncbi:MAG TPA: metal-dependent hydrolase [Planctomycetaceae bacterium]|nr:metal-dependent hydrolase [Blastopirellula sp.]HAY79115.1 metal-dependent hydrolase [Planctomycetaceae bacterium]
MADFKTHISASTTIGVGYGIAGYFNGMTWDSCIVAAGLCSVSGMLPDLDSDSGIPIRETITFAAAVVPMLMIDRFQEFGLTHAQMVALGVLIYVAIRFGIAEIFKRYTVHRGMWHSVPAALTATLLGFLICSCNELDERIYKALAVFIGFMTHLVLDEMYSIDLRGVRIKKSFGTAIKFFSTRSMWANISTYGKLIIVALLAFSDPVLMEKYGDREPHLPMVAREWFSRIPYVGTALQTTPPSDDEEVPHRAASGRGLLNRASDKSESQPTFGTFLR